MLLARPGFAPKYKHKHVRMCITDIALFSVPYLLDKAKQDGGPTLMVTAALSDLT